MECEEDAAMAALFLLLQCKKRHALLDSQKKQKRRRRRFKVRPLNRLRVKHGFYNVYFIRMKNLDQQQFFKYTRMTRDQFDVLVHHVTPLMEKKNMNKCISCEERLAITLHYLSQGSSMQTIAWKFQIGKTTVHCIIKETCAALCSVLETEYLQVPNSNQQWVDVAKEFAEKWNFPHCIGALDGKHINIRAPNNSGSMYFNYLKTFSLVLLAACDANYKFLIVDIGGYGSISDGGTLKTSIFGEHLENNILNIPDRQELPQCRENIAFPYFFVADAAFPLSEHIMKPYPGQLLVDRKENFNQRLSRARRVIENSFGILAARWRILYHTIHADVGLVELMTRTCVCLHNMLLAQAACVYCPPGYVDIGDADNGLWRNEVDQPLQSLRSSHHNAKHNLYILRDHLARYLDEGHL